MQTCHMCNASTGNLQPRNHYKPEPKISRPHRTPPTMMRHEHNSNVEFISAKASLWPPTCPRRHNPTFSASSCSLNFIKTTAARSTANAQPLRSTPASPTAVENLVWLRLSFPKDSTLMLAKCASRNEHFHIRMSSPRSTTTFLHGAWTCNFPTRCLEHYTKQLLSSDDNHKTIQTVVRNEFERVAKQPFNLIYYMLNVFLLFKRFDVQSPNHSKLSCCGCTDLGHASTNLLKTSSSTLPLPSVTSFHAFQSPNGFTRRFNSASATSSVILQKSSAALSPPCSHKRCIWLSRCSYSCFFSSITTL